MVLCFPMANTSTRLRPARFVITAISPEPQKPENENYEIATQLNDNSWTPSQGARGVSEIRSFLYGQGVGENTISRAIEELSRSRKTDVRV